MPATTRPPTDRSPTAISRPLRLLITAGPTHEPIDRVRYIGNRSSGRLGVALAESAARRIVQPVGSDPTQPPRMWQVTLLLGPTSLIPADSQVRVRRFLTTADLHAALTEEMPDCDVLVMAAAVADYRPKPVSGEHHGKIRRGDSGLTIELEPTPDLLAGVAAGRRPDQVVVGFALEPRVRLLDSARAKLVRKGLDLIVANPLETMDAPTIEATVLDVTGTVHQSSVPVPKEEFAKTLLSIIEARVNVTAGVR
jgi:phosphopantothenoylcysteine decarboxylase/phosphopantothenate--cysteine ligase